MTDDQILDELRTIRHLLSLEKKDALQNLVEDLDDQHEAVITQLSHLEWRQSTDFKSDLADEFGVSNKTIERKIGDLVDRDLIERRGSGRGTEYRRSGLLKAIETIRGV